MSGSTTVAIVTPIVMLPLMGFWLIMVFHADRNPGYRHRPPMPVPDSQTAVTTAARPGLPPPQDMAPAPAGKADDVGEGAGHGGKVLTGH